SEIFAAALVWLIYKKVWVPHPFNLNSTCT
ncbi:MAG: hypothetical protein ACI8UC_001323, partial [Psychromonas sp.]